jgi:hypothetical protein
MPQRLALILPLLAIAAVDLRLLLVVPTSLTARAKRWTRVLAPASSSHAVLPPRLSALSLLGTAAQPSAPLRRAPGAGRAPASPPVDRRCCPALPHHYRAADGCLPCVARARHRSVFALCSRRLR